MCGIAGAVGLGAAERAAGVVAAQHHRGPDAQEVVGFAEGRAALGVDRLRIVDLDPAADGVLRSGDGRWHLAYNGEVYNHVELRRELASHHEFRTHTDTEVVLAAWSRWGVAGLDRLVGMFAFLVWDDQRGELHGVRDRFGVKPLVHTRLADGTVLAASEPAALLAVGVPAVADLDAWARLLVAGHEPRGTFWQGIDVVPAGGHVCWRTDGSVTTTRWWDLADAVGPGLDDRPDDVVAAEVQALLADATALRFRADVPVGVALSAGLDSGTLLDLVDATAGDAPRAVAFTFTADEAPYDELAAVTRRLEGSGHRLVACSLRPEDVPELAEDVHRRLRAPVGGLPTLAYARLFEQARDEGVRVVLDGQGLDESWAGYDYHARLAGPAAPEDVSVVQGTRGGALQPDVVVAERRAALPREPLALRFPDRLRQVQARDLLDTKLPRALRYNDGVSMRASVELREPFLDHRLVELALRQPPTRTVGDGEGKALLRAAARRRRPGVALPAKQPVQTPQREWLRGPLRPWADGLVRRAVDRWQGELLDADVVHRRWAAFLAGEGDTALAPWQWITLGLEAEAGG